MLSFLSAYIPEIPPLNVDGIFGSNTRAAVLAAQRRFRLPETGVVDARTWDEIYDQYSGIENTTLRSTERFPVASTTPQARAVSNMRNVGIPSPYSRTTTLTQFPGKNLSIGSKDPVKQEVVR
jgi:hypothetical protein